MGLVSSPGFEPRLLALSGSQKHGVVELHYMLWATIVRNTLGSLWIILSRNLQGDAGRLLASLHSHQPSRCLACSSSLAGLLMVYGCICPRQTTANVSSALVGSWQGSSCLPRTAVLLGVWNKILNANWLWSYFIIDMGNVSCSSRYFRGKQTYFNSVYYTCVIWK